ncbi:unnamed protein product [Hermetia illucens]|uniref:Insulin-like domain-containing protein n=1 Tax=Hermetia illucens TaxID=343691 RepID=A0A7R8UWE4_HERIL|nr:unnamed protein product [Hermetia illucens]
MTDRRAGASLPQSQKNIECSYKFLEMFASNGKLHILYGMRGAFFERASNVLSSSNVLQPTKKTNSLNKMALPTFSAVQKVVFITVVLAIIFAPCESESQKLCGSKLTDALKLVCRNKYNMVGKKSVTISDYYDDDAYNFDSFDTMPFLNKLYAGVISPNVRRIRQGIVNECCKKPCSLTELSAYCYTGN